MQPVASPQDTAVPGPARPAPRPAPAEDGWPLAALARVAELEYQVEQLCRDAKVLQIYGGTDEIQISQIARSLLDTK